MEKIEDGLPQSGDVGFASSQGSALSPEEVEAKISEVTEQLKAYGEINKLRGLEGRIQRGLDPAGMLAVKETRAKMETVAQKIGVSIEDVEKITNELHVGAIWKYADKLAEGDSADVKAWMIAGEACVRGKEKEGDMGKEEFLADMGRVNGLLDEAASNPEEFAKKAKDNLISKSKEQFVVADGVAMSEQDAGFLAMAVNGYKSGIVKDKGGLLFVGANELDYGVLEAGGLKATEKEDRGRKAIFYIDNDGKDVVKKLYPGFAIILNGDMEAAKNLARTGERTVKES